MESDYLLTRTALYRIQYSPKILRSDISTILPPIRSVRHHEDGSSSMTAAQARARRLYDIGVQDEECDTRTAQIPSDFTANAPPFQVTTECSDSETEGSGPLWRNGRLMSRGYRRPIPVDTESEDDIEMIGEHVRDHTRESSPRPIRRDTASNITLAEAVEASQVATQEAVLAVGGELMVPHARFFIERDKSKCTVKFDPPVTGRFILLKMWSPHHSPNGNIDIQSVVARGYAGPRLFPAVTFQ
jgi:hypothetical protein